MDAYNYRKYRLYRLYRKYYTVNTVLSGSTQSPSHRTYIQERTRQEPGSKPDELLMPHIIRAPTTSLADPLYPEHMECPHLGCWKYRFRNSSDSFRHECLFHPGQRMQRRVCHPRVKLHAGPNQESALCKQLLAENASSVFRQKKCSTTTCKPTTINPSKPNHFAKM